MAVLSPFLLPLVRDAHACTCDSMEAAQVVARSDVIVIGTPEQIDLRAGAPMVETIVLVAEYLKGDGPAALRVFDSPTTCGVLYDTSISYLIHASRDDHGDLSTHLCSGTIPLDGYDQPYTDQRVEDVRAAIAAEQARAMPELPTNGLPDGGADSHEMSRPIVAFAALGALAGLVAVAALARRSTPRP
jgi:hypothetical protein